MAIQNPAIGAAPEGRTTALGMSTLAFTVCFAVWTIFSIIGVQIKKDLGLSDTQFGLLVGTPILTGSLIRLLLGVWTDQYGGRVMFAIVMLAAAVATWLLTFAYDYPTFLLAALGVGASWWVRDTATVDHAKLAITLAVWGAYLIALVLRASRRLVSARFSWACIALFLVAMLSLGPVNSSRHHQTPVPAAR